MTRYRFWFLALALGLLACEEELEDEPAVDADLDGHTVDVDCDDADSLVYPGAPELCDQRANDCDTMDSWSEADEAGTVLFTDDNGELSDLSESFSGDESEPATVELDQDGQLDLCEGTFYVALEVSSSLSLVAHGQVVLSGAGQVTIVTVLADDLDVSISGLTLQDGAATVFSTITDTGSNYAGGAISVDAASNVELADVVLDGHNGAVGGALFAGEGAVIEGTGITTSNNTSSGGGAIGHSYRGVLDLSDLNLGGGDSGLAGLSTYDGDIHVANTEMNDFENALYLVGAYAVIADSAFSGNDVAFYVVKSETYSSNVSVGNSSFTGNGEAILQEFGILNVDNCAFSENSAPEYSPAINMVGDLTVTNSSFTDNSAPEGYGAIFHFVGNATVTDSTFTSNSAGTGHGGALYFRGDTIEVSDCTFTGNSAEGSGSGIMLAANESVTLSDLVFTENLGGRYTLVVDQGTDVPSVQMSELTFDGNTSGAIKLGDDITASADGLTVENNTSGHYTGGMEVGENSDVALSDSIFENNTSPVSFHGGGITLMGVGAQVTFTDVDFSANLSEGTPSDVGEYFGDPPVVLGLDYSGTCVFGSGCS